MHYTRFAGLTAPDKNDAPGVNGNAFFNRNPDITDFFLKVGAVTHRHDGHVAQSNPFAAPSANVIASGGSIPSNTTEFFCYTIVDVYGGETLPSPPVAVTTQSPLSSPTSAIVGNFASAAGNLPVGNYGYALTYVDSGGGETTLGPTTNVARPPGTTLGEIILSGLAGELNIAGAVSWRLWRTYQGGPYQLIAFGSGDTFTDNGVNCADGTARPPTDNTSTRSTSQITVLLPSNAQEPALAQPTASAILLYMSNDGSFSNPCFYAAAPVASGGQYFFVLDTVVDSGFPPPVSTCIAGANKINPFTDIAGTLGQGTWQPPVACATVLPVGQIAGETRLALDAETLWTWNSTYTTSANIVAPSGYLPNVSPPVGLQLGPWITSDANYLYVPEGDPLGGVNLVRAKLDGSQPNHNFIHIPFIPANDPANPNAGTQETIGGLAVDSNYIYMTLPGGRYHNTNGFIARANLDGTGLNTSFIVDPALFGALAVDVDTTYIYLLVSANVGGATYTNNIYRAKLDGTGLTLIATLPPWPAHLPIDIKVDDTWIYWLNERGSIGRCLKTDGSQIDPNFVMTGGASLPFAMVIVNGVIYFTRLYPPGPYGPTGNGGGIGRVSTDGSGLNADFIHIAQSRYDALVQGLTYQNVAQPGGLPPQQTFFFTGLGAPQPYSILVPGGVAKEVIGHWDLVHTQPVLQGANVEVSGSADVAPIIRGLSDLEFAASGNMSVAVQDLGGGSARVLFAPSAFVTGPIGPAGASGAPGPTGPAGGGGGGGVTGGYAYAASAGGSAVNPGSYTEFVGSGGMPVSVIPGTGGSGKVIIGNPTSRVKVAGRQGAPYSGQFYSLYSANIREYTAFSDGTLNNLGDFADGGVTFNYGVTTPDGGMVAAGTGTGVRPYTRNADGTLTKRTAADATHSYAGTIAASPDSRTIYAISTISSLGQLAAFRRGPDDSLTQLSTFATGEKSNNAGGVVVSPDGRFAYSYANGNNLVRQYLLTAGGDLGGIVPNDQTVTSPTSIAMSPDGKYVYVTSDIAGRALIVYSRDLTTGNLTQIQSIAVTNAFAIRTLTSPDGTDIYVLTAATVRQLRRDPTTGQLTDLGSTALTEGSSSDMAIDDTGSWIAVATIGGSKGVRMYQRGIGGAISSKNFYTNATSTLVGIVFATPGLGVQTVNDVEFVGAGAGGGGVGITVTVGANPYSGSAMVTIAGSSQTPIIAGSSNTTPVNPDYYTEYAASAGMGVAVQNLGAGSARVVVGNELRRTGTATLSAGSVTVVCPDLTASMKIFCTGQDDNVTGAIRVTKSAGASFTIKSSNAGDTGVVAYLITGS